MAWSFYLVFLISKGWGEILGRIPRSLEDSQRSPHGDGTCYGKKAYIGVCSTSHTASCKCHSTSKRAHICQLHIDFRGPLPPHTMHATHNNQ
jgi:hypothetical protein